MLAGYRSFYLYSAFSIAVVALAVAAIALAQIGLRSAGIGPPPASADVSRAISLALALGIIAVPVGGAHLVLILRGMRDPLERESDARHGYLSLWTAGALVAVLIEGFVLVSVLGNSGPAADPSGPIAVGAVASALGLAAFAWARSTPSRSHRWRVAGARVVMVIALVSAAAQAAAAAGAEGQLFLRPLDAACPPGVVCARFTLPASFFQEQLRIGTFDSAIALFVWIIGVAWQWPWRSERQGLLYGVVFYGAGTAVALPSLALEASGLAQLALDGKLAPVVAPWSPLAAGVVSLLPALALLLAARRRAEIPGGVDRLLLAVPALVGLGTGIGGLALGWAEITDHLLFEAAPGVLSDVATPVALVTLGLVAYAPAWRRFDRLTRDDPADAARRFWLFTVVCLALLAAVVASVAAIYSAISGALGVGGPIAAQNAVTFAASALLAAGTFVAHLVLLLRDQRRSRAVEASAETDPLASLLEDVRAGRTSVPDAAARIRGGVSG